MATLQQIEEAMLERERAAQMRVTPEELARALAAVENRKAEEQQREADTIALGEAVRQLDLNVTPEELLAEVHRHRQEAHRAASGRARRTRSKIVLALVFCASVLINLLFLARSNVEVATASAAVVTPAPPLSELPDNIRAYLDFETLQSLANGRDPNTVRVDARVDVSGRQLWEIRKLDGSIYVDATASEQEALRIANGQGGAVYATHTPTGAVEIGLTDIAIPISRFREAAPDVTVTSEKGGVMVTGVKIGPSRSAPPSQSP